MPTATSSLLIAALLAPRRAAFRRRCRLAFAVVDDQSFTIDTAAPRLVSRGFLENADVSVVCNRRTLADLCAGRFDVRRPEPEHLFYWGGDEAVLACVVKALSGATTARGAQLEALRRSAKTEE